MPNADKVLLLGQDQTTAASTTNPVPTALVTGDIEIGAVEIKNGTTDTRATVLAASTAAQATDTALVVALSPNNGVVITPVTSSTMTATQVTVPATANGIAVLAANANRKGATIFNPGPLTVYVQQGATGVTTSNGFAIPAGGAYNVDEPLYLGAIYGIIASGTQVVTVVELT